MSRTIRHRREAKKAGPPAAVENGKEADETQSTVWLGNPLWPADPAHHPNPGGNSRQASGFHRAQ
jgi:hypothetical protein